MEVRAKFAERDSWNRVPISQGLKPNFVGIDAALFASLTHA